MCITSLQVDRKPAPGDKGAGGPFGRPHYGRPGKALFVDVVRVDNGYVDMVGTVEPADF